MELKATSNLESADPVLPIRWCLTHEEISQLKKVGARDVHIFFVIAYEDTILEDRQLMPLDQAMGNLQLRRPGKHTIFATLVWPLAGYSAWELRNRLLWRRSPTLYSALVLTLDRSGFRDFGLDEHTFVSNSTTSINVVVPSEHFPKEPPKWFRWIVELNYEQPSFDECQFRKRILASIIRFPLLMVWAVVTTLLRALFVVGAGFFGMRNIGYGAILHPWKEDINDVFAPITSSWFDIDNEGVGRSWKFLLLHPAAYLFLFVVITIKKEYAHMTYAALISGWIRGAEQFSEEHIIIATLTATAFILLVALIVFVVQIMNMPGLTAEQQRVRREQEARLVDRNYDELYSLLACSPDLVVDVSALPRERQTLHLRFQKFKAKYCRPWRLS